MPELIVCGTSYEVEAVVFDKDGTLVDFDRLWAGRTERGVDRMMAAAHIAHAHRPAFLRTIGVDPVTAKVIPETPLAVSTLAKLGLVAAVVAHQAGIPWHEAERLARDEFMPEIDTQPAPADLLPIGELRPLFRRLQAHGVRIAIATSDDRRATEAALRLMDLADLVDDIVCGDDPVPNKPSPEQLRHLARTMGVDPARMVMVGDSVTDMRTGRNAGVACCLGVLSGTGDRAALAQHAHHIADTVHAFEL